MSFGCVVMTILVSTAMSLFLFGGIELFMIISPAIFFIVTVSDIMHLVNSKHNYNNNDKKERFLNRLKEVGKPVLITSFTTMISFFSFILIDITPLSHFGIITGLGIMIALFFSVLSYAFIVNHNYDKIIPDAKRLIHNFIKLLQNKKKVVFPALIIAFVFSCFKISNVKIDNYLLDELNPSSEFYQTSKYIDDNFGGIKPISITVNPKIKISIKIHLKSY